MHRPIVDARRFIERRLAFRPAGIAIDAVPEYQVAALVVLILQQRNCFVRERRMMLDPILEAVNGQRAPHGSFILCAVDPNVMPNSFWNAEFLRRPLMLDAQDGQVMPVSVRDVGEEELRINASVLRARRYTVTSRYSQDVWYDDQARLVQAQLVTRDGSVIVYRLL
jgi:Domain of unknown function (DUF6134)